MRHLLPVILTTCSLALAQTRTYTFDAMGNRTGGTNQIRFTSAAGYLIDPTEAIAGERINLLGRNFPAGRNADVGVTIAGVTAPIVSVATNVITVTVPAGATTGDVRLSIVGGPQNQLVGTMAARGVAVTPTTVDLDWGEPFTFSATVVGDPNQSVNWSVNNIAGGNAGVGTITTAGLYTAPQIGSGQQFPFLVSATSPALGMTGYALVKLRCTGSTTIANRTLVAGTFGTNNTRHCYDFTANAGQFAYVALESQVGVQYVGLRDSEGTLLAFSAAGTSIRLADVPLPATGSYRIEVQGNSSTFGGYQVYVDRHDLLPRGHWLSPFSGTWQNAANWSRGELPGPTDAVVIRDFAQDLTVTASSGTQACASLTSNERFELTGGELRCGDLQGNAIVRLAGGTLNGATLQPGTGNLEVQWEGSELDGVTISAGVTARCTNGATSYVSRGLTVGGSLLYDYGTIVFLDSSTLAGTGRVSLGATNPGSIYANTGLTLTIATGVTVEIERGTVGNAIGNLINQGTIRCGRSGGAVTITGAEWDNRGLVEGLTGTTITTAGSWVNNATIRMTSAVLNLGGTFRLPAIGTVASTGGEVNITGTLDNQGTRLTLTNTMLNWRLLGGTIRGGEVAATLPGQLLCDNNCTLDGVRVMPATYVRMAANCTMNVRNGLTLDGTLWNPTSSIVGIGTQTIGGSGTIRLGGAQIAYLYPSSGTLTIDSGVTVISGNAYVGYQANDNMVLRGILRNEVQNSTLYLRGTSWRNEGTIETAVGATINISTAGFENAGAINVIYSTLVLAGTWSSTGTMSTLLSNLDLGGTFTLANLAGWATLASQVYLTGTLQNSSYLQLNQQTGSWRMRGGTIDGGSLITLDGTELLVADGTGTVRNLTVEAGSRLRVDLGQTCNVRGNLTVHGLVNVDQGALYVLDNNAQVGGTGNVYLGGRSSAYFYSPTNIAWSIEAGLTVAGQRSARLGYGTNGGDLTNRGTIRADTGNGLLYVGGTTWTNFGVVEATNGGSAWIEGTWVNNGQFRVGQASTLRLAGTGATTTIGTWINQNGTITLEGILDAAAAPLVVTGTWFVRNGTVRNGEIRTSPGVELVVDGNGTFDNVTIAAGSSVRVDGSTLTARNGWNLLGKVRLNASGLSCPTSMTFAGTGEITLDTGNPDIYGGSTSVLTFGPGLTIRALRTARICANGGSFVNQGTILAQAPNATLNVYGNGATNAWDNQGLMRCDTGSTLSLNGTNWRNSTGQIRLDSGFLDLRGTVRIADLGNCLHTGGTTRVYGTVVGTGNTLSLTAATTGSWQTHSGTIQNCTIQASGGTELQVFHGTLDGCTIAAGTTVRVANGGYVLTARNTIGAAAALTVDGTVILDWGYLHSPQTNTITGTGEILFGSSNGGNQSQLYAANNQTLTLGPNLTIRGSGNGIVGDSAGTIVNRATIRAETATRTIRVGGPSFDNQGTLVCTAGTLRLEGTDWRNSSGTITNSGGTLQFAGTFARTDLGTCSHSGGTTQLVGTMTNTGTFTLAPGTTGSWEMNGGRINGGSLATTGGTELRAVAGTCTLDGVTITTGTQVRVTTTLNFLNYVTTPMNGTVTVVGGTCTFGAGGTWTGTGTFDLSQGSQFYGNNNSTWGFGPGITFVCRGTGTNYFSGGNNNTVEVGGTLRLQDSQNLYGYGTTTLVTTGTVDLAGTGQLQLLATYRQQAPGQTVLSPGTRIQATTIDLQGGSVRGTGTLQGNVTSGATLRPGGAVTAGTLTVQGPFTQTATGVIAIELSGTTAGTNYDVLAVNGAATLGGTMQMSLFGGFIPATGNTFDVLTYASRTGTLTINSPVGQPLTPTYNPTSLRLTR